MGQGQSARPAEESESGAFNAFATAEGPAGILLDVDGTLSDIVAHPELAALGAGVAEVLARLVARYHVVAAISGRTQEELTRLVTVAGVRLVGMYGLVEQVLGDTVVSAVRAIADEVDGAWVESKGATVAVHHRAAPDPDEAGKTLERRLHQLAGRVGMDLITGKRVVELVPAGRPLKDAAVERIIEGERLRAALYAGDDLADIRAFAALDRARESGRMDVALKVAVRGTETPEELIDAADIVVDGPAGMAELLGRL